MRGSGDRGGEERGSEEEDGSGEEDSSPEREHESGEDQSGVEEVGTFHVVLRSARRGKPRLYGKKSRAGIASRSLPRPGLGERIATKEKSI
jgi:hypothetical protein